MMKLTSSYFQSFQVHQVTKKLFDPSELYVKTKSHLHFSFLYKPYFVNKINDRTQGYCGSKNYKSLNGV